MIGHPFAVWIFATIVLAGATARAQPDSVDYQVWTREALHGALRSFNLRVVELRSTANDRSFADTASDHLYHYILTCSGSRVLLTGNHTLELGRTEIGMPVGKPVLNAASRNPRSSGDSVCIELDSLGHKLSETEWSHGKLASLLRWKYGPSGRLLKFSHDYAQDGWHPEEDYHYDPSGTLLRTDLRNADGSTCGNHIFHHKDREVVEYDTSYVGGESVLTAVQLTAFDPLGRVERYVIKTFGSDGEAHAPFGIFTVYHDSVGHYRCDQFAYEATSLSDEARDIWAQDPWRSITYDSARHEETRIAQETGSGTLTTANRYLPDERMVTSKLSSTAKTSSAKMLHDLTCDYTRRGVLELSDRSDYPKATRQVLRFLYDYSAMGP